MKKINQRIIVIISTIILFISGCSVSKNGAGEKTINKENAVTWDASYSRLDTQYLLALATDCNIYGCYIQDDEVLLASISKESFSVNRTYVLSDALMISGMAADQEGNVYVLDNREESAGIWEIDADGSFHDYVVMELEDIENADNLFLKNVYTDLDGYFYVWCEMMVPEIKTVEDIETDVWHYVDRVYVKDRQFKTIFYDEISNVSGTEVLNFQVDADGTPLFIVKDQEGVYIQELDVDKEERKEEIRLTKAANSFDADYIERLDHIISVDNGFLYCRNNELYEFN